VVAGVPTTTTNTTTTTTTTIVVKGPNLLTGTVNKCDHQVLDMIALRSFCISDSAVQVMLEDVVPHADGRDLTTEERRVLSLLAQLCCIGISASTSD
jgi:hypothetical protein